MSSALWALGLAEAARRITARGMSAEDYAAACLERSRARDATVEAWAWLDPGLVLARARAADAALRAGTAPGLLHGLPVGVKDIIATADMPTEMGSPLFAGHCPAAPAAIVQRLEAAGGFAMGKTATTEFAFMHPARTRNPWNPAHTPGGSSSGSAAAVAAGFVPAALGTQTNGSVIRPAAFCGVVGCKPTQGLLPGTGVFVFSETLDQLGTFTRSVADAARLVAALAAEPVLATPPALERAPRLLVVRQPVWNRIEPAAAQAFDAALRCLGAAGAALTEAELPAAFGGAHGALRAIMLFEAARNFRELRARHRGELSDTLNRALDEGEDTVEAAWRAALALRTALGRELERFLAGHDAVVTPAAAGEAPAGLESTGDPAFCTIWTLCGGPALTLPAGLGPQGLPLGLQLAGARGQDAQVFAAAAWCEARLEFRHLVSREQ